MSYILDALRKSDQQRRLGGVPTLSPAPAVAAAPERSPLLLYGLLALTLVIAAMTTIAWRRPWSPEPAVIAITAAQPRPLPPPLPPQAPPRQIAPVVPPQAPAVLAAEAPRPAPAPAIMPAVVAPVSPRKPSASPATDAPPPAPAPVAARPARAAIEKAGESAGNSAGKIPSGDVPHTSPVASSALPAAIRKQLPPLSVAVHAYSDIPQDRLVSINGRLLREGDTLAPDLRLEQITPEGMVFTYRGYRFQRAAQ